MRLIALVAFAGSIASGSHAAATTSHYQKEIALICSAGTCTGDFPAASNKHQINITRVACFVRDPFAVTPGAGFLELLDRMDQHILYEYLPADISNNDTYEINQPVDVLVIDREHLRVELLSSTESSTGTSSCTATGTEDTD